MDYFKIERISNSDLGIAKNILLNRTPRKRPENAFNFGSAFHEALLEPAKYDAQGWLEKGCDMKLLDRMLATARNNDIVKKILAQAECEKVIEWTHEETNVTCKSKLDVIKGSKYLVVTDIKTTSAKTQESFEVDFQMYNYNRQAAFYMQSVKAYEFFCIGVSKTADKIFIVRKFLTDQEILQAKQDIKTILWQIRKHNLFEQIYKARNA